MYVDIQTTGHNSLRWTALAIDGNSNLSESLFTHSSGTTILLTDSIYLLGHRAILDNLPLHTHIILWDGINSYIEIVEHQPNIIKRKDVNFFVVGILPGVTVEGTSNIKPLYADILPDKLKLWNKFTALSTSFYVPYWYRALTKFLTYTRYFWNWYGDSERHHELNKGGKIIFCGLVTPTAHNLDCIFIGTNLPVLREACDSLTALDYTTDSNEIDKIICEIINAVRSGNWSNVSDYACIYSVMNVLHRLKTISSLHQMASDLFINETRNNRRIDPYDSFYYKNNLYLDFGSTRGPDVIYPRTLDLSMTDKNFISLRYLEANQSLSDYLEQLAAEGFLLTCESHAHAAFHAQKSSPVVCQ